MKSSYSSQDCTLLVAATLPQFVATVLTHLAGCSSSAFFSPLLAESIKEEQNTGEVIPLLLKTWLLLCQQARYKASLTPCKSCCAGDYW